MAEIDSSDDLHEIQLKLEKNLNLFAVNSGLKQEDVTITSNILLESIVRKNTVNRDI